MKDIKKQLTMEQVIESGRMVGTINYPKGNSDMVYEAAGCLFGVGIDRYGYSNGMWCMGKTARAARAYGIEL